MNNLLKFEFRKLFRSVSFYVCGGLALVFGLINVYSMSLTDMGNDMGLGFVTEILEAAGAVVHHTGAEVFVSTSSNIQFSILLPIMISLFFCSDFQDGTIKNIIGRGYSRTQVFFAKLFTCAAASIIYYLVSLVICTLYGTILWGFGSFEVKYLFAVLVQIIGIFAFSSMCSLLSILFRKVSGAITLGIFINLIFSSLFMVLDLWLLAKGKELRLSPFLLTSKISEAAKYGADMNTIVKSLLFCAGYGTVFTVCGYLFFRKREV